MTHLVEILDAYIIECLQKWELKIARFSLAIIFIWFGALKLFPGFSPAEYLAGRTIAILTLGYIPVYVGIKMLAIWEITIGIGFLTNRLPRVTIGLLWLQMAGAWMPLLMFPQEMFTSFPLGLTFQGQYIIKNLVLIAASFVIGARLTKLRKDVYVRTYQPLQQYDREKCGEYL